MAIKHKVICVTGSHYWGRSAIKKFIENHGGKVVGSVSSNVDYLVAGAAAGSKVDKAKALNIKVIDLRQLHKIANERTHAEAAYQFANDRARLEHALRQVFTALSVGELQQNKIITDVRACEFASLDKLLKQGENEL